jgi:hypothetical protein
MMMMMMMMMINGKVTMNEELQGIRNTAIAALSKHPGLYLLERTEEITKNLTSRLHMPMSITRAGTTQVRNWINSGFGL